MMLFAAIFVATLHNEWKDYRSLGNTDFPLPSNTALIDFSIHVNNNWSDTADFYNWCTGSGTYNDPYVIQNLVIDATGIGIAILIENSDDYFRIENCTVFNSGLHEENAGIYLYNTDNGQLINNNCSNNLCLGIYLKYSDNNTISGNIVNNNDRHGIVLILYSDNNTISENEVNENGEFGMFLFGNNNNNTIFGNTVNWNAQGGILVEADVGTTNYNIIYENTANYNNWNGIYLENCMYSNISRNNLNYNSNGIALYKCNDSTVSENNVSNNNGGIEVEDSNNNTLYLNNIIDNVYSVVSSYNSTNFWSSPDKINYTYDGKNYTNYLGNYWSDYTGIDTDNNGIGNTPYSINSDKDNYPLMGPFENRLIMDVTAPMAITDLTTSNHTEESITLNWIAPGDDGNNGMASGYVVKYSNSGSISESNWDSANTYTPSWTPLVAGSNEAHIISNLSLNTQYWFAIKAYDEVPNYGDISNSPNGKTLAIEEATPPIVGSPPDITYEEGTIGHVISWNATDDNPGNYLIYKDGFEVDSGGWTSDTPIKINVDGLAVGTYNYTIVVSDMFNNTVIDTVFVNVTSSEVIPTEIAGYPWITLIFSFITAVTIVILVLKRKLNTKF